MDLQTALKNYIVWDYRDYYKRTKLSTELYRYFTYDASFNINFMYGRFCEEAFNLQIKSMV